MKHYWRYILMGMAIIGVTAGGFVLIDDTMDIVIYFSIIFLISGISWLSHWQSEKSVDWKHVSEKELRQERDLLKIKVAERTLELKTSQAQRLADLSRFAEFGKLSRGLFHDLMTPLTSVALQVERLEKLEKSEKMSGFEEAGSSIQETRASIKKAITASEKMTAFMENIRRHIRQEGSHHDPANTVHMFGNENECDIGDEAAFVIDLLAYKAREAEVIIESHITSQRRYPAKAFYFHQIFQNLISNAIEACAGMKDKIVKVTLQEKMGSEKDATEKILRIIVSDNGSGIAAENMSNIFKPFFTTKQSSGNTGIGLHTVKSIVEEKLNGRLTVESTEGVGTTFIIDLP